MKIPAFTAAPALPKLEQTRRISLLLYFPKSRRSSLLCLASVVTACICMALAYNQLRKQQLRSGYTAKQTHLEHVIVQESGAGTSPATAGTFKVAKASQVIDITIFQKVTQSKFAVVLDARPEIFYRLGHVPGALSLSRVEFERDYTKQRAHMEVLKNRIVAIYCSSSSCEDSQMVADALIELGYQNVLVYKGGWDEWTHAGLPEEQ